MLNQQFYFYSYWKCCEYRYSITCLLEVLQSCLINGEKTNSSSIFRTHIGDCGSVGDAQLRNPGSKKFYKFSNNSDRSQMLEKNNSMLRSFIFELFHSSHLSYCEDQICGGWQRTEFTNNFVANNRRKNHADALTQHDCLSFNSPNP